MQRAHISPVVAGHTEDDSCPNPHPNSPLVEGPTEDEAGRRNVTNFVNMGSKMGHPKVICPQVVVGPVHEVNELAAAAEKFVSTVQVSDSLFHF